MTDVLRVTIRVQPVAPAVADGDVGWHVTMDTGSPRPGWPLQRDLRKVEFTNEGVVFPLPPSNDLAPAGALHAALCGDLPLPDLAEALFNTHSRIVDRKVQNTDIEAFGRYLFQTLIGSLWDSILAVVEETQPRVVELALAWPSGTNNLHRLNWEMMHGPNGFLATGVDVGGKLCNIAVTRVVVAAAQSLNAVSCAPRMLFVIGAALNDPEIRPGAELLGLLRQLSDSKRTLNSRILQKATPKRIQAAVDDFGPQAVHFICHGNFSQLKGRGYLRLQVDKEEVNASPDRFGDQLIEYLRGSGGDRPLPSLVVLSACDSGTVLGPTQSAPLAAELVSRGVPVVLSMAGRVSDLSCRLFTRRFGQALLEGIPLALATSQARRFAASHGSSLTDSPDWAFPSLFLAEGVPAGVRLSCAPAAGETGPDIFAEGYQLNTKNEPVFCDRESFMDAYFELVSARPVLIAWQTEHGMGLWRLIRELASQALRDGHLPLVIGRPDKLRRQLNEVAGILETLKSELFELQEVLGLRGPGPEQLSLITEAQPAPGIHPNLAQLLKLEKGPTPKVIARALALDLEKLNELARPVLGPKGRPIVLFNDLDDYHRDFLQGIDAFLKPGGLNATSAQPIPVVAGFTLEDAAQEFLKPLTESTNSFYARVKLNAFPPDQDEDLLLLQRMLLYTYTNEDPDFSGKPYVIAQNVSDDVRKKYVTFFRRKRGIPKRIVSELWDFVSIATEDGFLKAANDEDLLKQMQAE